MITELIDGRVHIWFRQSWLDTAFRCPERGRQAMVRPEWDEMSSDSALIGTAVHHGIEEHLNGNVSESDIGAAAENYLLGHDPNDIKYTKYNTVDDLVFNAKVCAQGWSNDIRPHLPNLDDAQTEVTFKIPLWSQHDYTVGITGTIDLVADDQLWDWKTSARPYRAAEKQKLAIQPTIYTLAGIKGDLVSSSLPMQFNYGIMIRGNKPKGQILSVTRTQGHIDFAVQRMMQFVDLYHHFGVDKPWPMNDDHFLCNQTWCPWWSICKGAHLTFADDRVGD